MTIHVGELTVAATVDDGYYAAWWPRDVELPSTAPGLVNPEAGEYEILVLDTVELTYDLTLADGSVISSLPGIPAE